MPSRWFLPIPRLDPARVKPEFIHATFTAWFDKSEAAPAEDPEDATAGVVGDVGRPEHRNQIKPYAFSRPYVNGSGESGIEFGLLTAHAEHLFLDAVGEPREVRLGNQIRESGMPRLVERASYAQLAARASDQHWRISLDTPATFRAGRNFSPLPSVRALFSGLRSKWQELSDVPLPADTDQACSVYVSYFDLRMVPGTVRFRPGDEPSAVPGSTGTLEVRCPNPTEAAVVGPLLHLANFSGVGAYTAWGFGVARVTVREKGGATDRAVDHGHAG